MKRYSLLFAVAGAGLLSCVDEPLPEYTGGGKSLFVTSVEGFSGTGISVPTRALSCEEIDVELFLTELESDEFPEVPGTKSAPVTEVHGSFGCSAYPFSRFDGWKGTETPSLFYDREVSGSGSAWNFAGGEAVSWPGAAQKVRFYAYSPYSTENPKMYSSASFAGAPVLEYTCSSDVSSQVDLLESVSEDILGDGKTAVNLTFRHALAAVKVKTSNFGFDGTITKVEFLNVMSKGRKVIGSDTWTDLSTPVDYVYTPTQTVPSDGDVEVSDELTVFMIPQTFGEDVQLRVTFRQGTEDYEFTCSLAGRQVSKGKKTSYLIGCDPADVTGGLELYYYKTDLFDYRVSENVRVTDGMVIDWCRSAEHIKFEGTSMKVHRNGMTGAAPWVFEAVDVMSHLDYGFELSGSTISVENSLCDFWNVDGFEAEDSHWTYFSDIYFGGEPEPHGEELFPDERLVILRSMAEVGSEENPVDLSMLDYNGNALASRSTANCYVVHAPGWYKIPLVYGNAIKDGATNVEAFYDEGLKSDYGETKFEDSYGELFTASSSPYVKTHVLAQGKTLGGAELLWNDVVFEDVNLAGEYLINVDRELMDIDTECPYIKIHIPRGGIFESNSVIAVKDSDGNVAWSWHLWITERDLSPETITNSSGANHKIMPVNLGWNGWIDVFNSFYCRGGDAVYKIDNMYQNLSFTIKMYDEISPDLSNYGGGCYSSSPYYQWGRKDPFIGGSEDPSSTGNITYSSAGGSQALAHQNPTTHYYISSSWTTDTYYYFWDSKMNTTSKDQVVTKTIYDPCPVGYAVPRFNTFTYFSTSNVVGSFDKGWYFKRNASDATGIYFPASGGRGTYTAGLYDVGSYGLYWLATPRSVANGRSLYFNSSGVYPQNNYSRAYGYSIRPAVPQ